VLIPTILTKKGVQMKFENQRKYAFSEETLDESNLPIDRGEINANDADSDDILHAIKELIRLKKDGYVYSENQIKLKKINTHNMLGVGASRISEAFIIKNRGIFFDED
jgi:hypothetical protein